MVGHVVTRCRAGSFGFLDDLRKVLPALVPEERLQITSQPEVRAAVELGLHAVLEAGMKLDDQFFLHGFGPFVSS